MTENINSFLKFEIIWKDDDMFEVKINASNVKFYGETEVYDTSDSLSQFANKLIDFPKNEKIIFYELGSQNSFSYCSIRFYCIDNFGKIGVELNIEENVSTEYRTEEKSKVKLEIIVEPSAIDRFQKSLLNLATKQHGIAILYGKDNRPDI
ncbi:hypothetical protein SAMN05660477_03063 [Soonwooa buanensis]|uniref:Uncharacterized protein n=1 Tax=Soonwooa buanensis TaxID=619805 RepID=A0A1T5GR92_9FLAO|nr:hypothetical protein [Soonwooa buanensis]SKC10850.1 hypothetical protein SAMN05660477_03063 [Soonwooa buanensis]